MNLSEALDAALPEMPKARLSRSRPPRLDPELVVREDTLDGEPIVAIFQRNKSNFFRVSPWQWQLLQLFDGNRSHQEIAQAINAETGSVITSEDVRLFSEQMEMNDFWYQTHQERNLALSEKLRAERGRRTKSQLNVSHISFSAWDPDVYLGWLDSKVGNFIYSKWCVFAVVLLFVFQTVIFIQNWSYIGPDTALFFNFREKGFADIAQFWILMLMLGFVHESAHGLTCKHYGGQVHSMGLMFLYTAPCFFVDVTETWVSASKMQRLATIIAGIWSEMTICGIAMLIWMSTARGTWVHNFSYEIILLTGIAVVAINLNPLIKLDGYYFLTEALEIPDLKERSTAFLSGWFQSRVLGLPVEMPSVPRRRAPMFMVYAFLSGLYSYLLLFFVVRISYNMAAKWMAEFALIPSGALAFYMFRSRLQPLRETVRQVSQHQADSLKKWKPRQIAIAALLIAFLFVPLWRDRENAYFVIEPRQLLTVHAAVPGRVLSVLVHEGERVTAGQPLLQMSSPTAAGLQSAAVSQRQDATYAAYDAQLQGRTIGTAAADQGAAIRLASLAAEADASLTVSAPSDGVVLTPNPASLWNQDVGTGQPLLKLSGDAGSVVRLYIPESALNRIHVGDEVALAIPDQFARLRLRVPAWSGEPAPLPDGILPRQQYQGFRLPVFYSTRINLPDNAAELKLSTSGHAKIFGERRSLAGRFGIVMLHLVKAHVW